MYYPTDEEIARLGFLYGLNEDGEEIIYITKEPQCNLTLEDDEGRAMVTEWLPDGVHAWITCESYEELRHTVEHAFEVLVTGRSKTPQIF